MKLSLAYSALTLAGLSLDDVYAHIDDAPETMRCPTSEDRAVRLAAETVLAKLDAWSDTSEEEIRTARCVASEWYASVPADERECPETMRVPASDMMIVERFGRVFDVVTAKEVV